MTRAALLVVVLAACRTTPLHPTTPSSPTAWAGPCNLEPESGRPIDWACASREMARGLRWVEASRPDEAGLDEPERADVMRACPVCFLGQSRDCVACADSWAEEWLRDGDCAWVSPLPQYGAEFTLCPEY